MSEELMQASFDYGALDEDTRIFIKVATADIQSRLKRTAEDIIAIGQNLIAVKAKLPSYQIYLDWITKEFDMSERSARRFMDVAERLGDKSGKLPDLKASALYLLAAPSTPDTVISQVESGEIPPTLEAIKEAKDAQRKAEQDKEEAERQAATSKLQLTLFTESSQNQIAELTRQITDLQEQLKDIQTPETIEVVPPETLAKMAEMKAEIKRLTEERERLAEKAVQLTADIRELREGTREIREEERYVTEIKNHWKRANEVIYKALAQFVGSLPSPLDLHLFEGEEWARYDQTEQALTHALTMHRQLKSIKYEQVIESYEEAQEEPFLPGTGELRNWTKERLHGNEASPRLSPHQEMSHD